MASAALGRLQIISIIPGARCKASPGCCTNQSASSQSSSFLYFPLFSTCINSEIQISQILQIALQVELCSVSHHSFDDFWRTAVSHLNDESMPFLVFIVISLVGISADRRLVEQVPPFGAVSSQPQLHFQPIEGEMAQFFPTEKGKTDLIRSLIFCLFSWSRYCSAFCNASRSSAVHDA